jgi:hypothetical protein
VLAPVAAAARLAAVEALRLRLLLLEVAVSLLQKEFGRQAVAELTGHAARAQKVHLGVLRPAQHGSVRQLARELVLQQHSSSLLLVLPSCIRKGLVLHGRQLLLQ